MNLDNSLLILVVLVVVACILADLLSSTGIALPSSPRLEDFQVACSLLLGQEVTDTFVSSWCLHSLMFLLFEYQIF